MTDQPAARDERTVLIELLRLYDWRLELAKREVDPTVEEGKQIAKDLRRYGREKKAAWEEARRVLAAPVPERGAPYAWVLVGDDGERVSAADTWFAASGYDPNTHPHGIEWRDKIAPFNGGTFHWKPLYGSPK